MHTRSLLVVMAALLAIACDNGGSDDPLRPDAGPPEGIDSGTVVPPGVDAGDVPPPPPGGTTYYEHVRPILVENCVMCHTTGGIAPFSLESYDIVFEVGERMAEVTHDRIMPPFLADTSGECNEFNNDRTLSDGEIAVIQRWVDDGKLEGDPSTPMPEAAVLPSLPSVDLTLQMPSTYDIQTTLDDDYRCFVVETGTTTDQFVTGYEVHPGNPERVHHVIVYNPQDDGAASEARDLDAADGTVGDGYPCFGGPRVTAAPMVLWAPGAGATNFPRGTGVQLAAGRAQVVQVHYNNLVDEDAPEDDLTTVDLSLRSSANQAYIVPIAHGGIVLPPRMESVTQSTTQDLSVLPVNVRAWGAFPHMHTLGRQLRVERSGSADTCMIDIPRWDFNWQLAYWYEEPITIQPGDDMTITCTYNTMERDETVRWGDGTQDEMCLNFFYVTL